MKTKTEIEHEEQERFEIEDTANRLTTALKELEIARAVLLKAADIFDNYHDLHAAKTPPDMKKALANKAHADKCRLIAEGKQA